MALLHFGTVLRPYTKPHASPTDRVRHLRSMGLSVSRPTVAARKIEQIGYERLRIYFLSRRDRPGKRFRPGTTYRDILQIYQCDAELRELCFTAVGRFDLAFRNSMSEVVSARHGSHPYYDGSAFKSPKAQDEALRRVIDTSLKSRDERAKHYRRTYDTPALPPVWMFKEFLAFGAAARFYERLSNVRRQDIAAHFSIASLPVFDSWVTSFVDLRNICAHHDCLFNRRFQKQPTKLKCAAIPTAPNNTLKGQIECLDHVLTKAGGKADTVGRAKKIVRRHRAILPAEAGF